VGEETELTVSSPADLSTDGNGPTGEWIRKYRGISLARELMDDVVGRLAMASTRVLTGFVLVAALAASPASADQGRRRSSSDRSTESSSEQGEARARAVPRAREAERPSESRPAVREQQVQRQANAPRSSDVRRESQPQYDARTSYAVPRAVPAPNYSSRGYAYGHGYGYGYGHGHPVHVIRPAIVTVVPYRPYVYHPSIGIGVYYGAGGAYPYGYTPRGYYDPIPGRVYGGLRITGAPRDAQVFADGYYVGIVNDFDGTFQHLNLEAGAHRIEIGAPGFETIAFDVMVQPGRTMTFRADMYRY